VLCTLSACCKPAGGFCCHQPCLHDSLSAALPAIWLPNTDFYCNITKSLVLQFLIGTAGSQDVDDDEGSDSSGHSNGSGESDRGHKKKKSKKKRQSGNSAGGAEGFVEVEVDEPAQLMTMLPVSGWFHFLDHSSFIMQFCQMINRS